MEHPRGALASLALAATLTACAAPRATPAPLRPLRPDTLEHNGQDRDADLLHVDLDLRFDFGHRSVAGTVTNAFRALRSGTRRLRLHGVGLSVEGVHDGEGRELRFDVREPVIEIELAEALERGAEVRLAVTYSARPEKGLYFVETSKDAEGFAPQIWSQGQKENNRYWLPTWDYPNDRASVSARLRVGDDMNALSNGRLVEVALEEDGERTYRWELEQEIATYLIAVAAGRWERYADDWNGLPVEYYVPPGSGEEKARRAFGETPDMLTFFTELLDEPFPYPKYAQVAVAQYPWGGMENASLTVENDYLVGDAGTIGDLDGNPRLLVAHELAHQWFGDLVTCFGWSHLWLNEGWAAYLELLYEEHVTSHANFELWLERYREWFLIRGPDTRLPVALDWFSQGAGSRENHVYDKGPWILHMIHKELGDEPFWLGVRAYLDRYANGLVTTDDFVRVLFDVTGRNVEGLVEQWVEAGGYPIYRVTFDRTPVDDAPMLALRVRQVQDLGELVPIFDMPVDVDLHYADGSVRRHTVRVREQDQTFLLPLEGELLDVVFDAGGDVLCDVRLDKPTEMWVHQASLAETASAQWRAMDELHRRRSQAIARLAILRILRTSPEPLLRERAALYADFRDSRAWVTLVEAAMLDPAVRVRRQAAHTLLQHASREQFEPGGDDYEAFIRRLADEPSPAVRRRIRELLGLEPE